MARGYWIEITADLGAAGDNDYFVEHTRSFWSRNGKEWEEQPEKVLLYNYGSSDPEIFSGFEEAAESVKEYDTDAAEYINEGMFNADPRYTAVCWEVDNAGIQRNVKIDFENIPEELINLINLLELETEDEKYLSRIAGGND